LPKTHAADATLELASPAKAINAIPDVDISAL
jgi:hypothetical protein